MSNPIKAEIHPAHKDPSKNKSGTTCIMVSEDDGIDKDGDAGAVYIKDFERAEKLAALLNNWNPDAPAYDRAKVERLITEATNIASCRDFCDCHDYEPFVKAIADLKGESK